MTYHIGLTSYGEYHNFTLDFADYQILTLPTNTTTLDKVREFKNLETGWCYGEGEGIKEDIISETEALLNFITDKGFYHTDAFPGTNGEIMINIYEGHYYAQFIIEPNRSFNILLEVGGGKVSREKDKTLEEAKDIINKIRSELWSLLDGSTLTTSIPSESDLPNWPSESSEKEYLSLTEAA